MELQKNHFYRRFTKYIDEFILKGFTYKKIEDFIRENGYTGSSSTIRMYVTRKRRLEKKAIENESSNVELVDRQHLIKLLYRPLELIKELTSIQYNKVVEKYPILSEIYDVVKHFKQIFQSRNSNELDSWIEKAKQLNISGVNSFIKGISRDKDAVKNSIKYEYNNGLAEGSVNKIKVIKRIMYGRCNFETLRKKVLQLEKFRKVN